GGNDRKPGLELVRRADIVQQTGEDWIDVALSVSTVRTAKGGAVPELKPLIVRFEEPRVAFGRGGEDGTLAGRTRGMAPPAPPAGMASALRQADQMVTDEGKRQAQDEE